MRNYQALLNVAVSKCADGAGLAIERGIECGVSLEGKKKFNKLGGVAPLIADLSRYNSTRSVFKIIGKTNYHDLNRALYFCYVNLLPIVTYFLIS